MTIREVNKKRITARTRKISKIKKRAPVLNLDLEAGAAKPAPKIAPALSPYKIRLPDFCKDFNDKSKNMKGLVPTSIKIRGQGSYEIIKIGQKRSPNMIQELLAIKSGSKTPGREKFITITNEQLREIAQRKMVDMNSKNIESAMRTIAGTARSMGILVQD